MADVYVPKAGEKVWTNDPDLCYKVVTVKAINDDKTVQVFDEEYKTQTVPGNQVYPVNPPNLKGCADNTEMMFLHDPSLLDNLKTRYDRHEIYTYTAYILIAINPYQKLDIYGNDTIEKYYGKAIGKLPPHVFAIADRAFRSMKQSKRNQSIVISGESGAGKTETAKLVLRFTTYVAGSGATLGKLDELENKILEANPILEAFGNAKTLRNNNSSRFGKFTELHFDKEAKVAGASIETYLLENSRLVWQSKGERNFHVFYQLLQGASADIKQSFGLSDAGAFDYLNKSSCVAIDGVDDAKDFAQLTKSFKILGMDEAIQKNIFATLAGLLHLGNVEFTTITAENENETTEISKEKVASQAKAAELLGLDVANLANKLLTRTMVAGGKSETYIIPLTPQEAVFARDSLAKFIYSSLFDWLVKTINSSIPLNPNSSRFIGILDISGFEIFENNSFEQFCINFANEKIQQYFNHQILQQEQEIYQLEGLRWRKVDYVDNQAIIDLVENKRSGILALLDEECVVPKATDKTFAIKVHTTHTSNAFLDKPKYAKGKKRLTENEAFVVKHFAGEVIYEAKNFLSKNNGTLHDDLSGLLFNSANPFIKALFPKEKEDEEEVKPLQTGGRFKSVGAKFQKQLQHLMSTLEKTTSHFIRCIKPNNQQKPEVWEPHNVMTQLRYSGMCAALVLMQAGFPTRVSFEDLYERYKDKMPAAIARLNPITFCEALLVALDLNGGADYQLGLTKVFFRAGKLKEMDELTSDSKEAMQNVVRKVMKWLARKRFHAAIWAVVSIRRFGKLIHGVRAVRRFRRAARYHVYMARIWIPLVTTVRKRLYSEEVLRKRAEEEAKRREEERRVEELRKAEEARKRAEEEEERRRQEEERLRIKAEKKKRKLEAQKQTEERLQDLQATQARLEENILAVNQSKDQVDAQNLQLLAKIARLEEDVRTLTGEKNDVSQQLANETAAKQASDKANKELHAQLSSEISKREGTEAELAVQLATFAALQQRLEEERASHEQEIKALKKATESDVNSVLDDLKQALGWKAQVENQLRDESDAKRVVESKRAALEEALAKEKAHHEKDVNEAADEKAQLLEQHATFKATIEAKLAETVAALKQEQEAKAAVEATLAETIQTNKSTVNHLNAQKQALEEQLAAEKKSVVRLNEDLNQQKEETESAESRCSKLSLQVQQLETSLTAEVKTVSELRILLSDEKAAHKEDLEKASQELETVSKKASNDISNKQAVIDSVSIEKKKLEQNLANATKISQETIARLEAELKEAKATIEKLQAEVQKREAHENELIKKMDKLEQERTNLIEVAIKCQEAQLQLRNVYERFPKDQELAKLLFGDAGFNTTMRGNTAVGTMQKQGGSNPKKWAQRHFVLNDNFLFYYANKGDKDPRGIIRLDQAKSVEKVDLSALGKRNAFTIRLRTGRDYFMSCDTEEDMNRWMGLLDKVVG